MGSSISSFVVVRLPFPLRALRLCVRLSRRSITQRRGGRREVEVEADSPITDSCSSKTTIRLTRGLLLASHCFFSRGWVSGFLLGGLRNPRRRHATLLGRGETQSVHAR